MNDKSGSIVIIIIIMIIIIRPRTSTTSTTTIIKVVTITTATTITTTIKEMTGELLMTLVIFAITTKIINTHHIKLRSRR